MSRNRTPARTRRPYERALAGHAQMLRWSVSTIRSLFRSLVQAASGVGDDQDFAPSGA